jgi:aminoglycoside 2'-N-acetyltransferase I
VAPPTSVIGLRSVVVEEPRCFTTGAASDDVLGRIRELIDRAFAGDFTDDDWAHTLGGWHVVIARDQAIVAHAAAIPRFLQVDHLYFLAGYVEGVATSPSEQRRGLGSEVMRRLSQFLQTHFEIGALSTGSHAFFERLGWERWSGPTFVSRGGEFVRTEEDDDGLMVLRFGPSEKVALDATICCDDRPGDAW